MASESAAKKIEFTFQWKIHNFSYCWQEAGDCLESPEFSVDMGQQTKWRMFFCPRGIRRGDYASLFAYKETDTRVDGDQQLNCQFSFLSGDTVTSTNKLSHFMYEGRIAGLINFMKQHELNTEDRAKLLPEDTLTVRCSIWPEDGRGMKSVKYFARTMIKVEQTTFIWPIKDFSSLKLNQKMSFVVKSLSNALLATLRLFVVIDCCDEKVNIEIEFPDECNIKYFKIESCILNEENGEIEGTENVIHFHELQSLKYSLPLTKVKMLEHSDNYLFNGILNLKFKCTYSTGIGYQEIERIDLSPVGPSENKSRKRKLPESSCTLTDDVKSLYGVEFLSDMKLRTSTDTFPVHKILLSARSPVFTKMFANPDLKENKTNCVNITDVDSDTLRRLLLYIYTDSVEDLEVNTALQLYKAADKYWVHSLKDKCSTFLSKNLDQSNVCDMLVLADMHGDEDFKSAVQDYILQHECVFRSIEWKNLISIEPRLTAETMVLKFRKL